MATLEMATLEMTALEMATMLHLTQSRQKYMLYLLHFTYVVPERA